MKILITGATGMIGKEIGKKLVHAGHQIVAISRSIEKARAELPFPAEIYEWKNYNRPFPREALRGVDAVINLAGESIGDGRWTKKRKKKIYDSRIIGTRNLSSAISKEFREDHKSVKTFISASAIGIYDNTSDSIMYEDSIKGNDFLANVCKDWEYESQILTDIGIRVVNPRFGIVLSREGGALAKLIPLFTNGIGSAVGSGEQWMSWIHHDDLTNLLEFILDTETVNGPLNAVSPGPVTNLEFSEVFSRILHKKLLPRVPSFAIKMGLGEMSTLVLSNQHVSSASAINQGFNFKYTDLREALSEISSPFIKGFQEYFAEQWIPKTREEVFQFFSNEKNLERLTPPSMSFKVLNKSTDNVTAGTKIDYKLSIYGLSLSWKTEIAEWKENQRFIDVQLKGPYEAWHHTHEFIPFKNGTLLRDRVLYRLPMGFLGNLVAGAKVKLDLQKIFAFRRKEISNLFY